MVVMPRSESEFMSDRLCELPPISFTCRKKGICHLESQKASESKSPFIIKQLAIVIFNILADSFMFDNKKLAFNYGKKKHFFMNVDPVTILSMEIFSKSRYQSA
jgi:hypothetical protein